MWRVRINVAASLLAFLVCGSAMAQDGGSVPKENASQPRRLTCHVGYMIQGREGLLEATAPIAGVKGVEQGELFGGFEADLSNFLTYSELPNDVQLFALVGEDDQQTNPVFDIRLTHYYNAATKKLSDIGVQIGLVKRGREKLDLLARIGEEKNYDVLSEQRFPVQREGSFILEMLNSNRRSRVVLLRSECYFE